MKNTYFQFKQFRVEQAKSAMKVNTDGCLLGAMADFPNPNQILDIGTGTGLIALMLAQKYDCQVDAVEIDENSASEAKYNFEQSQWKDRMKVFNISVQDFAKQNNFEYDLIVSNPPYFNQAYLSPNPDKNLARHTNTLSYQALLECTEKLLTDKGTFFLCLPAQNITDFSKNLQSKSLNITLKIEILASYSKNPYLVILGIRKQTISVIHYSKLVIADSDGFYTPEFTDLMKQYYLYL